MVPWVLSKSLSNTDPLSRKPVPVVDHPTSKKMLLNVQFIPLLVQLWIIPMHPIAGSQQEGISISFLRDLLGAMRSPLRPPLLQSRQTSATTHRDRPSSSSTSLFALVWLYSSALVCFLLHSVHTRRPRQCWIQLDNPLFWLSGCPVWDAPKAEVCPLGCQGTCWPMLSLLSTSTPRSLSAWLLSSHFSPK